MPKHTNHLIQATSPYLLQHAHNPVNWYPWGEEVLEKAKKENKPIILSIGYAACHWCHVMERESFENEEIAEIMNENFISIKVDREERPDIDQVYMNAIHVMGLNGGWPLHVFLTPEGEPFYGGTYFPPDKWKSIITQISAAFKEKKKEIYKSAQEITKYLQISQLEKEKIQGEPLRNFTELKKIFEQIKKKFDKKNGGMGDAPKFPMPSNYFFLLHYYQLTKNKEAVEHIIFTLYKMGMGGIYDHIGGGFSRYSVDDEWRVPHFEKMLYDNAQLISLYSDTYRLTKDTFFKEIVEQSIDFLYRELYDSKTGGFYSSLDADSEGEEGKFYSWTKEEIDAILLEESPLFCSYYNVKKGGNWENGLNILRTDLKEKDFSQKHKIDLKEFQQKKEKWKKELLHNRNTRISPTVDNKILTAWNALMLSALCDAYKATKNKNYLKWATKNAELLTKSISDEGSLWRSYENRGKIKGYLSDYACFIQAMLDLFQLNGEEKWLWEAKKKTDYVLKNFYDEKEEMFFFAQKGSKLIVQTKEIFDNVIPSSNSIMAMNLHTMGILFDDENYKKISQKMLDKIIPLMEKYSTHSSNWACVFLKQLQPTIELVIVGKRAMEFVEEVQEVYLPNKVVVSSSSPQDYIPLLENRGTKGKTLIYVCQNRVCQLPVDSSQKAIKQIMNIQKEVR